MRLTVRRLDAIASALAEKLAGEIDPEDGAPTKADYENALTWAQDQLAARQSTKDSL